MNYQSSNQGGIPTISHEIPPCQVRGSDGVERRAKEEAIRAKFAEISAAYELSLNRESSEGSSSISHLSSNTSRRRSGACAAKLASVNTDFGSGAHRHHFTDPFELFRKTFGSSRLYDFIQPTCRGSFLHDDIHIYVQEKER